MKKVFFLPLFVILLMGAGCTSTDTIPADDAQTNELEAVAETPVYVGTWFREHIFVDGSEELGQVDSIVVFTIDNNFTSETDACRVEGTIEPTETSIRMLTVNSTCPEQATALTSDITYDYIISNGGNTMTNTTIYAGVEIVEIYSRVLE